MKGIFLMAFYCEAHEFSEGQCVEQCEICRQEDIDETAMHVDDEYDYRRDPVNQPENIR